MKLHGESDSGVKRLTTILRREVWVFLKKTAMHANFLGFEVRYKSMHFFFKLFQNCLGQETEIEPTVKSRTLTPEPVEEDVRSESTVVEDTSKNIGNFTLSTRLPEFDVPNFSQLSYAERFKSSSF